MAAVAPNARTNEANRLEAEPRDRAAALYERHARRVYRYCLALLRRPDEADDALQTTFLNAQRALARGVVPVAECAWLLGIARNVCRAHWSEHGRRLRFEESRDPRLLAEHVPAASGGHDELLGLEQALEGLTVHQQRAIVLREWQGLSYREIGAELGLSQAAVETLIFRARRALAAGLRDAGGPRRSRLARGFDLGSLAGPLKQALAGLSGAKGAALVAAAVAGGLAGLAGLQADVPEPPPAEPARPHEPGIAAPAEPATHEIAAARAEGTAFRRDAAPQATPAREETRRSEAPAPAGEDVKSTLGDTTAAVVGVVAETADSLVGSAGGAASVLTAGIEETAAVVASTPPAETEPLAETLDATVAALP